MTIAGELPKDIEMQNYRQTSDKQPIWMTTAPAAGRAALTSWEAVLLFVLEIGQKYHPDTQPGVQQHTGFAKGLF